MTKAATHLSNTRPGDDVRVVGTYSGSLSTTATTSTASPVTPPMAGRWYTRSRHAPSTMP